MSARFAARARVASMPEGLARVPAGTVLCTSAEVTEGSTRGVATPLGITPRVILTRLGGKLFGWLDRCPHYPGGSPMAYREHAYLSGDKKHLCCYAHGALFDIVTGRCVRGPCLGKGLTPVPVSDNEANEVVLSVELCV